MVAGSEIELLDLNKEVQMEENTTVTENAKMELFIHYQDIWEYIKLMVYHHNNRVYEVMSFTI